MIRRSSPRAQGLLGRTFVGVGLTSALVACTAVAASADGAGGAAPPERPEITGLRCVRLCGGATAVRPGGLVRVRGNHLDNVATVVFRGGRGNADDVRADPRDVTSGALEVRVPRAARSGPLRLRNADGLASPVSRATLTVRQSFDAIGPDRSRPVVSSRDFDAQVQTSKVFFDSGRRARLIYRLKGDSPRDVRFALTRRATGRVVTRWTRRAVPPGTWRTIRWSGTSKDGIQRDGDYDFRVTVIQPSSTQASSGDGGTQSPPQAKPRTVGGFLFLGNIYPVRGRHSYGSAGNRFGAPRSGHRHQGQDVLSPCGTRLVAARGGKVEWTAYHSAAGYYLVIDGARTGVDYVYMHLRGPALVRQGRQVRTGQLIGYVGRTGDASACHLHFEMWSSPGWYSGGAPFDPLPYLRAWDRTS